MALHVGSHVARAMPRFATRWFRAIGWVLLVVGLVVVNAVLVADDAARKSSAASKSVVSPWERRNVPPERARRAMIAHSKVVVMKRHAEGGQR